MTGFRRLFTEDLPLRFVDFVGHVVFAAMFGHWYWQFVPDMMLPFLLLFSFSTNSLLPENCFSIRFHKFLHTIWFAALVLVSFGLVAGVQVTLHVLWDQITHKELWNKKSLWTWS